MGPCSVAAPLFEPISCQQTGTRYCDELRANLEEPGRMALLRMMTASKAASEERLSRVMAPTLVIIGSRDPDFKDLEAEAQWVAESLRGTYKMKRCRALPAR